MKNNYIIATIKSWNINNFLKYLGKNNKLFLIQKYENLNINYIEKIKPKYIFFPHWSWIIPKEIWQNYECVVFHMTDLPYGRGGTPLQNLILKGHIKTKISAIKVNQGLDSGDIYLKRSLSLTGSAQQIYERMSKIIFTKMVPFIIKYQPKPIPQTGKVTEFKRRTQNQSELTSVNSINKLYDFIRMLDAQEYPKAFIQKNNLRFEFSKAQLKHYHLSAHVDIYEK